MYPQSSKSMFSISGGAFLRPGIRKKSSVTLLLEFNFSSFFSTMHWSCPITGESRWDRVGTSAFGDGDLSVVVHCSDLLDLSEVVWKLVILDPATVVQRSIVSATFDIFVGLGPFIQLNVHVVSSAPVSLPYM